MSSTTTHTSLAPVYLKALKTWRPVILYFGNEHSPPAKQPGRFFVRLANDIAITRRSTC